MFGAAFALRLILILLFPGLPDLLTGRVEVSTPVSSFKRRMDKKRIPPLILNIHLLTLYFFTV